MYHNPLHLDTYKELMRMEAEVLRMTASLVSQTPEKNAHGVITSGGSESLIMALYAYKKFYANRTKPNMYFLINLVSFPIQSTQLSIKDAFTSTSR